MGQAGLQSRACNINSLWAWVLTETLVRLGLKTAVIAPGSRSGPLTVALAEHPKIAAIPILDERSASFFALGVARQSHQPVLIVCTSGTAAANFYPAIIEASLSHVSLLVLTADRPPELRDCHAGQAMDQTKLYGHFPRWQTELGLPSLDLTHLAYLRQTINQAWSMALMPTPGPVHLNIPLREPLAPIPDSETAVFSGTVDWPIFFQALQPPQLSYLLPQAIPWPTWSQTERGVIIAGPCQPAVPNAYAQAVLSLSQCLDWPILADALSPVRHFANESAVVISLYDLLLRNQATAESLKPDLVIQLGELPTSKPLRTWLERTTPARWIISPQPDNFDPLHGASQTLRWDIETLAGRLPDFSGTAKTSPYHQAWIAAETIGQRKLSELFGDVDWLCEPKLAWLLSQTLPPQTPIFVASSMPVRDMETVFLANSQAFRFFFNRGVNGIDGTLSTALGVAWENQPTVLITGDLALLHDTNGFLLNKVFKGSLTIISINNHGGGIFAHLPIHQAEHVFDPYFATPQEVNFQRLAQAYGVQHHLIGAWPELVSRLNPLPKSGIHLIEVPCLRERDAKWRQKFLYPLLTNNIAV
ncbi:2-succinyl-5-enolpyruvyl-6-hydroxy-3-cyclohexene-1-carboxylic-acid synthase [Synechococcus sp. PCC 6312]|uniref:2-succinyl-5-enolpyruvyl-6-hydroxy-3- cyclohexene-1-carboxylic-acid synthase n=1 Tax=Synechococcus sp. (strain ATCC 27167 / PCC 6312) TaxID=195253 RepID=UPI003528F5EF